MNSFNLKTMIPTFHSCIIITIAELYSYCKLKHAQLKVFDNHENNIDCHDLNAKSHRVVFYDATTPNPRPYGNINPLQPQAFYTNARFFLKKIVLILAANLAFSCDRKEGGRSNQS